MTIEVSVLVGILAMAAAIYFGLASKKRSDRYDVKKEATDMTTVVVKLENINNGINEIKSDFRNMRADLNGLRDRVIAVELCQKQANELVQELRRKAGLA